MVNIKNSVLTILIIILAIDKYSDMINFYI